VNQTKKRKGVGFGAAVHTSFTEHMPQQHKKESRRPPKYTDSNRKTVHKYTSFLQPEGMHDARVTDRRWPSLLMTQEHDTPSLAAAPSRAAAVHSAAAGGAAGESVEWHA